MKTAVTFPEVRAARASLAEPVGLVPTMGYLHAGHLSLVRSARSECASVVVSIFVNPTQFGPQEDLAAYPRDLTRDLQMLESEKVDLVWLPTSDAMYPPDYQTWVSVETVTQRLEGAMRPGHFRGVATVVTKLFTAVLPDKAYFGQKDAQQAVVVQQLTRDLNLPVQVVICPTVREPDGLALSSRNAYLSPEERRAAACLYRALSAAQSAFQAGERRAQELRKMMDKTLHQEPLAHVQYVSCADPVTLEELDGEITHALLSMAVFIGKTRLIDNLVIKEW